MRYTNVMRQRCQQLNGVPMKKNNVTFYNATQSADYLKISRQYFYVVAKKYKLLPSKKEYNMKFYAALDLDKIRRLLGRAK